MFFVELAARDPRYYVMWVFTVVVSIVLHELAHGWMAIRLGDDTPRHLGRMTGNPLVHMGGFSILVLLFFGIAWGMMPIDHSRLRGRYAEAKVAAAGPGMNLILSLGALVALGLWLRLGTLDPDNDLQRNAADFLMIFGSANLLLCLFNLFPVPPLDGSHILANFHYGYARFISDPNNQQYFFFGFILVFFLGGRVFGVVPQWAGAIVALVAG